ncbi:MAG: proline--tRNA ligase, partial [Spirochaetae bacterium HGW-Spirochaetae-9]
LVKDVEIAEKIYTDLTAAGIEVLYDDRKESAGVKFADADLIGVPVRITLGNRSLKEGNVEVKLRGSSEDAQAFPLASLVADTKDLVASLMADIRSNMVHRQL